MTSSDPIDQYPLPPSVVDARTYTDPARFQREVEAVFFKTWLPACPSTDVAAARNYVVFEQLGQSIVIARDDAGGLVAWHNVCQHRGTRIVAASGHCEKGRFTCPWHGFQYDLAGKVRFTPMKAAFDEALLDDLRAPPVRVAEYAGFAWFCLSGDAPDLRTYLGDIATELDWFGLEKFDFTKVDIDINITPAGKVDGPSAGGLMVTAIISALTGIDIQLCGSQIRRCALPHWTISESVDWCVCGTCQVSLKASTTVFQLALSVSSKRKRVSNFSSPNQSSSVAISPR